MKQFLLVCLISIIGATTLFSQGARKPDHQAYISLYKDVAIREMKLYKIPASITLAQGIIESNCGLSPLATEANNHFGIKCHKEWTGEKYYYDDDEKGECFRKYNNALESYRDHSLFLVSRSRYAALFSLDPDDYTGWAMGLKQAGYATNPEYPNILIRVIEANKLYLYDDTLFQERNQAATDEVVAEKDDPGKAAQKESLSSIHSWYPDPEDFEVIDYSQLGRKVYENNGIPFIIVKEGDTWYSIAKEFAIFTFQVYSNNDLTESDVIQQGQALYLEPKKRHSFQKVHTLKNDETLYKISQQYGIKLKLLYKYNNLKPADKVSTGTLIHLHR